MSEAPCEVCDGTGHRDECPECFGAGGHMSWTDNTDVSECSVCHGTGKGDAECDNCLGTGVEPETTRR